MYQKMNAFPSISHSSDCNKNKMMHTNVTTRSKIKVWADDAMKVQIGTCLGVLQNIHVPLIFSQYMPGWAIQFLMFVFQ
jgi:hypothetical protein